MKILLYDIETAPAIVYTWGAGLYDQQVIKVIKDWELLSVAYKWLGEKDVHCITRQGQRTDKSLAKKIWKLLNEADIVIAHNGIAFDNKKVRQRFIKYGCLPIKPFKVIDTKVACKSTFGFTSNSLDYVAKYFGVGEKIKHRGFDLWEEVMAGDRKAWAEMISYNKHDVRLLEAVYMKLRPWMPSHPIAALTTRPDGLTCPRCGSAQLQSKGYRHDLTGSYRRYRCVKCGGPARERLKVKTSRGQKVRAE